MADTELARFFDTNATEIQFLMPDGKKTTLDQKREGACVTIGSNLVYAFCDGSDNIYLASCNLNEFRTSRKKESLYAWRAVKLADSFPGHKRFSFRSDYALSLVASGGSFYLFWEDKEHARDGAARGRPELTDIVCTELQFSHRESALSNNLQKISGGRTAFLAPDGESITLGQFALVTGNVSLYGSNLKNAVVFQTTQLRPNDLRAFTTWSGVSDITFVTKDLHAIDQFSYAIGMAWFAPGPLVEAKQGVSRDEITPQYYLIMSCCKRQKNKEDKYEDIYEALSYVWNMNEAGLPWGTTPKKNMFDRWVEQAVSVGGTLGAGGADKVKFGASVVRDPAGRVLAYWANKDKEIGYSWFLPNTRTNEAKLDHPEWSAMTPLLKPDSDSRHKIGNRPCPAFVALPEQDGAKLTLPDPEATGTQKTYENCPQQVQVAFLLVRDEAHETNRVRLMTNTLGTTVLVPSYRVLPPRADRSGRVVVSLVADSFPYPVPDPGIQGNISPSGMVDWYCCAYEYLTGDEVSEATETDIENMFGIKAGYSAAVIPTPVAFVGPMGEASLSTGFRELTTNSRTVATSTLCTVVTKALPGPQDAPSFSISPDGAIFGREYPTLEQDIGVFLDREGKTYIQASGAERNGLHMPDPHRIRVSALSVPGTRASQYPMYCYDAGDLRTYAPKQINRRMARSFASRRTSIGQGMIVGGRDYSVFYADETNGCGYFELIVKEFGANCFGAGNLPYLEFGMSATGMQRVEYQDTSEFTSAGSFVLDSSVYSGLRAAVSVSVGAAFLSIGTDAEAYAMAGWDLHTELTSRSSKSQGWGVRIADYLNPLAPGEAYTVRMYFFKESPLWPLELKYFGNDPEKTDIEIDYANSRPTRIMFTVPYLSRTLEDRLAGIYGTLPG